MGSGFDLALYALGAGLGWWLGVRLPRLPPSIDERRHPVSVVIPARDEEDNIVSCIDELHLRPGDEVIVVDDHSRDATADRARARGVRVVTAPPLAEGWLGKPAACWHGAGVARHDTLVFVDADVRLGHGTLDTLAARVFESPQRLVSVQPWHRFGGVGEHAALLVNTLAIMSARPLRGGGTLAFGPVLACSRARYLELDGHAHPSVRGAVVEDVALGVVFGGADSHVGGPDSATFRMYPAGIAGVIRGFTRSLTAGIGHADFLVVVATVAWCASLVGGPFVSPWLYGVSAAQFYALTRRAGSTSIVDALVYPVHVAFVAALILRAAALRLLGREISWRGRHIATR